MNFKLPHVDGGQLQLCTLNTKSSVAISMTASTDLRSHTSLLPPITGGVSVVLGLSVVLVPPADSRCGYVFTVDAVESSLRALGLFSPIFTL